jgi:arabinose-5-phosphate isomerase
LISMTGNKESTLAQASDAVLDVSVEKEACLLNLAPTASTTASLAVGDALAIVLQEQSGFQEEDFAELHPGGETGRRLRRVEHLMHTGSQMAVVQPGKLMTEVVEEISRKGFGMTTVVDEGGRLAGVITDGDLRRLLQSGTNWKEKNAGECMSRDPMTIGPRELAALALNLMESRRITSLPVVGEGGRLEGLLHLHDLWTLQMF